MFEDTQEQWKIIDGFDGQYAVSNKGRIKNLKTNRIFTGANRNDGYKQVYLKGKYFSVHRLTALAFIPNPQKLPQVNHIDENKENNNVENLEWCSASYNTNYSIHNQSCKIKQLTKDGELVKVWESIMQIEKELGYNKSAIARVLKGKRRSAYNFKWEYLDPSQQRKFNRPIIAFKGGKRIGEFPSAKKAAEALGLCRQSVYYCLRGRFNSTQGYTFTYK